MPFAYWWGEIEDLIKAEHVVQAKGVLFRLYSAHETNDCERDLPLEVQGLLSRLETELRAEPRGQSRDLLARRAVVALQGMHQPTAGEIDIAIERVKVMLSDVDSAFWSGKSRAER
jgi:hypothetical protein